ncbi:MAG: YdbH domain-containing protein [Methylovulum sp.]|uniref:intermembrane phospholipid transport protein YdbH family protein n=3 Tax=Methylovulum sp. TaxID=1916980 RepID=UPI00260D98F5|nr:YdbH domain-containing protein [Methylovulum sp.]MDD2723581.1 YdbH domain-containing protein [Methylovulum sp.]
MSRLVMAGVIVLMIIGLAVWWKRSFMMQLALQQFLDRTALLSPKISGFQLGFTQAGLSEMEFGIETGAGLLVARLEDVKIGYHFNVYDFSVPKVKAISVGHARLRLAFPSAGKPAAKGGNGSGAMVFPLDQLTIENLDFEASTALGLTRFAGSAQIKRGTAEVIEAKFEDAKQSIQIELESGFRTAKVVVEQPPGGKVFELITEQLDQPVQQARVHAGVGALVQWLGTSSLLPETLQAAITTSVKPWIMPNIAMMQLDFNGRASDHFGIVQGKAFLSRDNRYLANTDLSMAKSGAVVVDGRLDMAATEVLELVQPWLPEMTREWHLSSGQIQGVIKLRWQTGRIVSGAAHFKAFDVALATGSVQIENGTINVDSDDLASRSVALFADVPSLAIGKGMTARNLIAKVRYSGHELTVEQGMLSIYDGLVEVLPATVNVGQRPVLLTLRVRNVDLSQLLSSLHYKDLTATGTVNGELPLKLGVDSIELLAGSLNGTRPGVLRYQGPVADKENLAFRALRNLEYHSLQAKVNYRPNGDYHLGLRMEGGNPEVLSGHPLAFNLNLSGHLPELLQRGFMAGDFERVILEEAKPKPAKTKKSAKPLLNPPVGEQQPKPPPADRRSQ